MKQNFLFIYFLLAGLVCFSQTKSYDFRDRLNGKPIFENGYIDQPYVVVLDSGEWLSVFTTGLGEEGSGGQHIVSSVSTDKGNSWSKPVLIEEPSAESASWAMPFKTNYGRIYVFYNYNGDKCWAGIVLNIRMIKVKPGQSATACRYVLPWLIETMTGQERSRSFGELVSQSM